MLFNSAYLSLIAGLLAVFAPLASANLGCHNGYGSDHPRYTELHGDPDEISSAYNLHQEVLDDIVATCKGAVGTYTHGNSPYHRCSDWPVVGNTLPPWTSTSIDYKVSYVGGKKGDQHVFDQATCVNLYDWELTGCDCGSVQQSAGMQISWEMQYGTCEQNETE